MWEWGIHSPTYGRFLSQPLLSKRHFGLVFSRFNRQSSISNRQCDPVSLCLAMACGLRHDETGAAARGLRTALCCSMLQDICGPY